MPIPSPKSQTGARPTWYSLQRRSESPEISGDSVALKHIPEVFPCTMAGFVRALFGKSRDRGDSVRFQKYEDLVDRDYDPFHHKCGKNVVFNTKKGLIATRRSGAGYEEGIVFSARPIPVGTMFQVKLLEKEDGWGVTLVSACE